MKTQIPPATAAPHQPRNLLARGLILLLAGLTLAGCATSGPRAAYQDEQPWENLVFIHHSKPSETDIRFVVDYVNIDF